MKPLMARKVVLVCCLCFALLAVSLFVSACSFSLPALSSGSMDSPTPVPGSSSRYPYSLPVTWGTCRAWRVVLPADVVGKPWCAETIPALHTGDYVQLSYGAIVQTFRIASVDYLHQVVQLNDM